MAAADAADVGRRARRAGSGRRRRSSRSAEVACRGSAASGAGRPERAALLQQLGEAYLRAPERYPTANVLAHEEIVPETHILVKGDYRNKGEKVEPGYHVGAATGSRDRWSRKVSCSSRSAARRWRNG